MRPYPCITSVLQRWREQFSISAFYFQPHSSSSLPPSTPVIRLLCQLFYPLMLNPQGVFKAFSSQALPLPISSSHLFYIRLVLSFLFFHLICTCAASLLCANKMITCQDLEKWPPFFFESLKILKVDTGDWSFVFIHLFKV